MLEIEILTDGIRLSETVAIQSVKVTDELDTKPTANLILTYADRSDFVRDNFSLGTHIQIRMVDDGETDVLFQGLVIFREQKIENSFDLILNVKCREK